MKRCDCIFSFLNKTIIIKSMKISKGSLVYALICNFLVCAGLAISSNLSANGYVDLLNLAMNFCVSYPVAVLIGLFVPFLKIGTWFTRLFKIVPDTYTNNIGYRLLATLIASIIYFLLLNPSLTCLNVVIIGKGNINDFLISWLKGLPLMVAVGYALTIICDFISYRIAHIFDKNF